jgi:DamX protein
MSAQVDTLQDNRILNFESPQYWQAYGLHQDPLAMDVDPRMYYAAPHWEEYIDLLQYLCHYNNDLLVIAGVGGSGKTTLINEFIAQVDETMRTCYATADSKFIPLQLLDILADGFDLSEPTEESLEEQLDAYLDEIQESDKICVLAIDNAHTLSADVLRTLLHLVQQQSETQMRLHILLLGEPQLQMALLRVADAEGCERDQIHNLTLEPLSLDETQRYLRHRLTVAGLTGEFPLSDESVKRIYKLSEGIPGRINRIARRVFLNEMPQSETQTSSSLLTTHRYKLLGGVVLAGLIFAVSSLLNSANKEDGLVGKKEALPSIAFQSEATPESTASTTSEPTPATAPATTLAPQETTAAPSQQATATAIQLTPTATPSQPEPALAAAKTAPTPAETPPATSTADEQKRNWQQNELHAITNSAQKTTATKPAVAPTPTPAKTVSAVTPSFNNTATPEVPSTAAISETASSTQPTAPIKAASVKPAKKKATPAAKTQASTEEQITFPKAEPTKSETAKSSSTKPLSSDEKQLLDLPESSYTLQLIGLSSAQTARKFIMQHNLTNKVSYFRTSLNAKPLFVLVYGNYASLQEANAALATLPSVVQNLKPWPRSMRIIQDTIKQGNINKASLEKPAARVSTPSEPTSATSANEIVVTD